MVKLVATDCGKKYRVKWVFRNLNFTIEPGQQIAITGKNGSGKSTLIKILSGYTQPGEGTVKWFDGQKTIAPERLFQYVSIAAPYIEAIEEFTLPELIAFQDKFKPFKHSLTTSEIIQIANLQGNQEKPLQHYSSGMKQRALLTLTLLSSARLVLLDEPCANLDKEARSWYADILTRFGMDKTVVIASNHNPEEYPEVDGIIPL